MYEDSLKIVLKRVWMTEGLLKSIYVKHRLYNQVFNRFIPTLI